MPFSLVFVLLMTWWLVHVLMSICCIQVLLERLCGDKSSVTVWKELMYVVGKNELRAGLILYFVTTLYNFF